MTGSVPTSTVDLYSDEVIAEPYAYYRHLREAGPAVWLEPLGAWAIPRYDGVRTVLKDFKTFSSAAGVGLNDSWNTVTQRTTLASDDLLRNVVGHEMTASALQPLKERIEKQTEVLLERLIAQKSFDAVEDLARVLPLSFIPDFIGLPEKGHEHLLEWGSATFNMSGPLNKRARNAQKMVQEMVSYAHEVTASGNLCPGSFGAGLLEAAKREQITQEQCPILLLDYLGPSLDTTISAIGSAIWLFGRYPEQWDRVRKDPSLIPNAFEEILRFETPLQVFSRKVTRDCEISGIPIEAGARVLILFGSANRDESRWERADSFDVTRPTNGHVGFGYGIHLCAGAALARMEGHIVLQALARRVERFEIGKYERQVHNTIRSLSKLQVTVYPATT